MTARTIFFVVTAAFLVAMAIALVFVFAASAQERYRGGGPGWGQGDRGGPRHYSGYRRPGYRYESGRGWYDPSAAIGGAIGSYLWKQWRGEPVKDVAWCMNRYKSYDPYTRTYLGYDGLRHACP